MSVRHAKTGTRIRPGMLAADAGLLPDRGPGATAPPDRASGMVCRGSEHRAGRVAAADLARQSQADPAQDLAFDPFNPERNSEQRWIGSMAAGSHPPRC